ncbi:hypothetical protein LWI28_004817 [Acer negundo]|uniref:Large ribosomal subunit protein bL32m n=1 Tax=Acer negundo TaxID=4023 RepID=A0AAD5NMU1_ACENE|nr:hypothetical protein LWI28_004817 [Acer negundo]KAK4841376.1 hypothetical protein QYF36_003418 [Acer negundo]
MALRLAMLKSAGGKTACATTVRSFSHVAGLPPPLGAAIDSPTASLPLALPEFEQNPNKIDNQIGFPSFSFGGSMELMAVPKRKTTPHKRGIRNGPKALKPVPVIIRCRSCGRVKLPHFFCCSGERRKTDE